MRRLLTILAILMLTLSVSAQTFDALWKQVEKSREDDKPQTCITLLQKIQQKAEKEKQYGHLIAALFSELSQQESISRDSLTSAITRLDNRGNALYAKDKLAAWVFRVAKAKYVRNSGNKLLKFPDTILEYRGFGGKNATRSLIDELLLSSDKTILDALTRKDGALAYLPLVRKEKDSRLFNNDLVSILAAELDDYQPLVSYYQKHGQRQAACISAALYVSSAWGNARNNAKREALLSTIDGYIEQFKDLEECGALGYRKYKVYSAMGKNTEECIRLIDETLAKWPSWCEMNELRNDRNDMVNPQLSIRVDVNSLYSTTDAKVILRDVRNIKSVSFKATPVVGCPKDVLDGVEDESTAFAKLSKYLANDKAKVITKTLAAHKEWERFADTLSLGQLSCGIYLLTGTADGKALDNAKAIVRVTDLRVLALALSDKQIRYVVVNAGTGHPLAGAKLHVLTTQNSEERTFTTDEHGEYILTTSERPSYVYATTTNDDAQKAMRLAVSYLKTNDNTLTNHIRLFTDRSIYRPGQTVKVSALAYSVASGTETEVTAGKKFSLVLYDANNKKVATNEVTTDDYGVVATEFQLPKRGLNGRFSIRTQGAGTTNMVVSFNVEEYVRPTFDVSIEKPTIAYKVGETITVNGQAKAYSGAPVSNARVVYTVMRKMCWWWWRNMSGEEKLISDTITTDGQGRFTLKMPMLMPEDQDDRLPSFYTIQAEAQVTDLGGESHSATLNLSIGNRESIMTTDMKEKYLGDSVINVIFTRRNMAGVEIDGKVDVTIDGKVVATAEANKALTLPEGIASGKHELMAVCGNDTVKQEFVVFRKSDTRPVTDTKKWCYQSAQEFGENKDDVVWVQIGTSDKDVNALYSIFDDEKQIESGTLMLDSSVVTREFKYKKEYGKGITYTIVWVKDGQQYTYEVRMKRNLPDMNLTMKWATFRNKLQPGQKEEWRLSITDSKGKPADANLMATLYDKSLDAILSHKMRFSDPRYLSFKSHVWRKGSMQNIDMFWSKKQTYLEPHYLSFSRFENEYFDRWYLADDQEDALLMAAPMRKSVALAADASVKVRGKASSADSENHVFHVYETTSAVGQNSEMQEQEVESEVQVRENLSELAFFLPQVRTDAKGIATLGFTLPESVTTWRLLAFANDKQLRFGTMTDEVVAQKSLMVQPRLPRFVREGDKVSLSATVSNLTDKDIDATLKIELLDAETEKVIYKNNAKVRVKAGETIGSSFSVDFLGLGGKMLVCKTTVVSKDFSDGEQHYLPVLSTKEQVMDTRSYVLTEKGVKAVEIAEIVPEKAEEATLKVDYTDSPECLLVQSLPYVAETTSDNAISLASALYANSVASTIANSNPAIQNAVKGWGSEASALVSALSKNDDLRQTLLDETPWMADADNETSQRQMLYRLFDADMLQYRSTDILDRLSQLQNADGSWSWWKGMSGSRYITMSVMKMLTRMTVMTGGNQQVSTLTKRAWQYLDKEVAKDIEWYKKNKTKAGEASLSSLELDYLYCLVMSGRSNSTLATQNANYLMSHFASATTHEDMATKARLAIVYAKRGEAAKAKTLIESIKEHTVYREDVGRYFDSYRASYSWYDYKIPTQVAVVEALKCVTPSDTKTVSEMQRWLLQSKRTQMWDTPINAVNAIYAFFGQKAELRQGVKADIKVDGKSCKQEETTSVLGYVKAFKALDAKDKTLSVEKTTDGESWMNVYVMSLVDAKDVNATSNGITVKREYDHTDLHIGDKVTVTITITADRDYDFVSVTDGRPACFEPVVQLSGYRNGAYQVMKDSQSQYHFDMLRKGTHTIKTEYYVTQKGTFTATPCRVQCAYSPEFCGRTKGIQLKVER